MKVEEFMNKLEKEDCDARVQYNSIYNMLFAMNALGWCVKKIIFNTDGSIEVLISAKK